MKFIIIYLLVLNNLFAQELVHIAVLDLDSNSLSSSDKQILSDRLRTELFNTGKFKVLERSKMNEILEEQSFQLSGCTTDECVVEIGKIIGVKNMVAGVVGKLGKIYTVNIRMIDVEKGSILNTATVDCQCNIENVLTNSLVEVSQILAGNVMFEQKSNNNSIANDIQKVEIVEKFIIQSDSSFSFFVSSSYFNLHDSLTNEITAESLPVGATFNHANHKFSWWPNKNQSGIYIIQFKVYNYNSNISRKIDVQIEVKDKIN